MTLKQVFFEHGISKPLASDETIDWFVQLESISAEVWQKFQVKPILICYQVRPEIRSSLLSTNKEIIQLKLSILDSKHFSDSIHVRYLTSALLYHCEKICRYYADLWLYATKGESASFGFF